MMCFPQAKEHKLVLLSNCLFLRRKLHWLLLPLPSPPFRSPPYNSHSLRPFSSPATCFPHPLHPPPHPSFWPSSPTSLKEEDVGAAAIAFRYPWQLTLFFLIYCDTKLLPWLLTTTNTATSITSTTTTTTTNNKKNNMPIFMNNSIHNF